MLNFVKILLFCKQLIWKSLYILVSKHTSKLFTQHNNKRDNLRNVSSKIINMCSLPIFLQNNFKVLRDFTKPYIFIKTLLTLRQRDFRSKNQTMKMRWLRIKFIQGLRFKNMFNQVGSGTELTLLASEDGALSIHDHSFLFCESFLLNVIINNSNF